MNPANNAKRALLLGFFSTFGDIECLKIVKDKITNAGIIPDVAPYSKIVREAIPGSLDLRHVDPSRYNYVFVICGPCSPRLLQNAGVMLDHFSNALKIGVNLTMVEPISRWNPFDVLLERDSDRSLRADLSFLGQPEPVAVGGCCVIAIQGEYGRRQRHAEVIGAIDALFSRNTIARVDLDTRFPTQNNTTNLRSSGELASLISRLDVVVTNRLHGLAFAIANGVPTLAIDAIDGSGKVKAQASTIGWPLCFEAGAIQDEVLDAALAWCLTPAARDAAQASRHRAIELLSEFDGEFAAALTARQRPAIPRPVEPRRGIVGRVAKFLARA